MVETDFQNAVAVTREIYWIGFLEETSRLKCNPYLLIDGDDVIIFYPGSLPDFPGIMRKILDIVSPEAITAIVVSHQDPDVCGNLAVVEDVIGKEDLLIAAHINTIRLIQHQVLRSKFYPVDKHDYKMDLKSGRRLEFQHVPFLHSPGAITTYDAKSKSVFTGDIFGAISDKQELFVNEDFPECMDSFHQAYMPSSQILSSAMERFEKMDIERILPQHGFIIEGDEVQVAIRHLKTLPVGIDLMD